VTCAAGAYSFGGAAACSSCAAGASYVSSSSSCTPSSTLAPGPADTAFYLSGTQAEGVAALAATGPVSFVANELGAANGAILLASGSYLTVSGANSPAALPSNGSVAFSASAWVKCPAIAPPSFSAVLEWGSAGDAGAAASRSALWAQQLLRRQTAASSRRSLAAVALPSPTVRARPRASRAHPESP
jgi:hypothetical protein